jgi:large subunit ribosomal protein L18e
MKRGTTNPLLAELVGRLRKTKKPIWKDVAEKLEAPTRSRAEVNLWRLDKNTKDGETVVVPGKVLSEGELGHKLTIAAWAFSQGAATKLEGKAKCMTIDELVAKNPDGKNVRIMVG